MADPTPAAACFWGPPGFLEPDFAASGEQHGEPGSCCRSRSSEEVSVASPMIVAAFLGRTLQVAENSKLPTSALGFGMQWLMWPGGRCCVSLTIISCAAERRA